MAEKNAQEVEKLEIELQQKEKVIAVKTRASEMLIPINGLFRCDYYYYYLTSTFTFQSLRAEIRDLRCTTHRQLQELSAEEQDRALLQSEMVVVQANCDKLRQIIQGNQTGAERPWASETRVSPTFQAGTVTHETDSSVESLWEDRLPRAGAEEAVILKAQNQMLQRQAFGDHSDKLVYRLTVGVSYGWQQMVFPEGQFESQGVPQDARAEAPQRASTIGPRTRRSRPSGTSGQAVVVCCIFDRWLRAERYVALIFNSRIIEMALSKTRRLCLNTSSVWGLGPPPWAPLELKTAEDSPTPTNSSDFVACVFNWNHGGHEVFVTGSFNDWSTSEKVKLTKMGGAFTAVEELPMGRHLYKFIVDGAWKYDPQLPLAEDGNGNVNNVIDLEDYVPYDFSMPDAFQEAHQATFFQEIPELSSYTYDAPQMPSVLTTGVCAATDPPPRSNLPYLALGTHLFFDSHAPVLFGARIYSSANTHRWRATPNESTGGQK